MVSSWTESVWDEHERALVDAWQDWRNSLHKCGRPRSESFRVPGQDDPVYGFIKWECAACEALEREQARLHKAVKKDDQDAGINPAAWRELEVVPAAGVLAFQEAQQLNQ